MKMKKMCFGICKHRKFKNPKTLNIFGKISVLSIICNKCKNKDKKLLKKKISFRHE